MNYSKAYNYLDALKRRGYNPRQRRWGRCSLTNCPHIFGLYYKLFMRRAVITCLNGHNTTAFIEIKLHYK